MQWDGGEAKGWILCVHFGGSFFLLLFLEANHVVFLHVFIQAVKIISSVDQLLVYLLMLWRVDDGLLLTDSCFLHSPMRPGCLTTQYLLVISVSESLTRLAALTTAQREGSGLFFQESCCFWKVVVLTAGNLTWSACFYSNTVRNTNKMHCTRLSPSSALPLHSTYCFHATSAVLGSSPSAIVVCGTAAAVCLLTPDPQLKTKKTSFINYCSLIEVRKLTLRLSKTIRRQVKQTPNLNFKRMEWVLLVFWNK